MGYGSREYGSRQIRSGIDVLRGKRFGGSYNSKKVDQLLRASDGEEYLLGTFTSATSAAFATGIDLGQITRCCRGKIGETRGFIFRYHEDKKEK